MENELQLIESYGMSLLWRNPDLKRTKNLLNVQSVLKPQKCKKIFETRTFSDLARTDHIRVYQNEKNNLALLTICEYYPPFSLDTASWYSNEKCFGYKNIFILTEKHCEIKKNAQNITYVLEESINGTWEIEILVDHEYYGWIPLLCRSWICQDCKTKEEAFLTANINPACYHIQNVREGIIPDKKYTPEKVTSLAPEEIFVFGSNIKGMHGGGAAAFAMKHFGAEWGVGEGLTGQCYALPTMEGGIDYISEKVSAFISFARQHIEYTFLVTPIACGIAGFSPQQIAPLFREALAMNNVVLPKSFLNIINH